MKMDGKRFFTDAELEKMVFAVAKGQGVFSETDVEKLYDWIFKANIDKSLADLVLDGKLVVDMRGTEIAFKKQTD